MRPLRRQAVLLPWGVITLIWMGCATAVPGQDTKSALAKHARAAREAGLGVADRKAHARAFAAAARPEDWPLAFELVREVAYRHDELERELAEARRPVTNRWDPDDTLLFGFFAELERAEAEQKRKLHRLEAALRAEEAVLDVFRSSLTGAAARSDPEAFVDFVARQARVREPVELAKTLRALGFFPTPAARRLVLDHLDDRDPAVGLAAARACEEHARAFLPQTASDPLWPEAFERLQSGLHRASRDRDVRHRRYRVLARKSAAIRGKMFVGLMRHLQGLENLLQEAMRALSDRKNAARRIKRAAASVKSPEALGPAFEKALKKHEQARQVLRAQDRRIRALLTAASRVFDCLKAEQRVPFETRLAERLANATPRPACLRLIELCGHLRSEALGTALLGAASAPAPAVRVAACLALEQHARPQHVHALAARLRDSHWQVKIAAVRALRATGRREAVDALVSAVGLTQGRVRDEVNSALRRLTGEDFQRDALRCRQWWDQHREEYRGPVPKPQASALEVSPAAERAGFECFGIRTHSTRITFLLDRSAAMTLGMGKGIMLVARPGTKVDPSARKMHRARNAMADALAALPADTAFNVLLYGDEVTAWKPDLVPAHARNKKAARKWLAQAKPDGGASVFDALVRAFDPTRRAASASLRLTAADTFFLVAGAPASGGDLAREADIVEEIERWNRLQQVAIHTVAVGESGPIGFLRALASRCGGQFAVLPGDSAR